ncbi:AAA family ATPase [Litorimonas sp. WD9-15]|uniref:AAA family ATPase n=1 Tax=Litorimonas sp. WD9-15 TaxID=3418716 RepID=UPI003D06EE39
MVKRRRWSRRREDDRVAKKEDYALIQDADLELEQDDLSIPQPEPELEAGEDPDVQEVESVEHPATPTGNTPQIFAVIGATGGVGTTSLATQLAHEFAVSTAQPSLGIRPVDPRICLIDLDFESGACAHHLDLLPSLTLEDLCGPSDQIDTAFTSALVSTHESGISLLAAPNTVGANARVNPRTVMAILDAAADLYDVVIIDMPRYRQSWSLPVMQAVDVLAVTAELTIPSLHAAREMLTQIAHEANGSVNAQAIIGKYERRSFKNMLKLGDAETALGRDIFATICQDPDSTREALNCGEPAGVLKSDSRFVKDVRTIAGKLKNASPLLLEEAA